MSSLLSFTLYIMICCKYTFQSGLLTSRAQRSRSSRGTVYASTFSCVGPAALALQVFQGYPKVGVPHGVPPTRLVFPFSLLLYAVDPCSQEKTAKPEEQKEAGREPGELGGWGRRQALERGRQPWIPRSTNMDS